MSDKTIALIRAAANADRPFNAEEMRALDELTAAIVGLERATPAATPSPAPAEPGPGIDTPQAVDRAMQRALLRSVRFLDAPAQAFDPKLRDPAMYVPFADQPQTKRAHIEFEAAKAGIPVVWNDEVGCFMRTDRLGTVPFDPEFDAHHRLARAKKGTK